MKQRVAACLPFGKSRSIWPNGRVVLAWNPYHTILQFVLIQKAVAEFVVAKQKHYNVVVAVGEIRHEDI